MSLKQIKETSQNNGYDHGCFLPHQCPVCGAEKFHLIETRSGSLWLTFLGIGTGWKFRCEGCSHSIPLNDHEAKEALFLKAKIADFHKGKVTAEQLNDTLAKSSLACLHDLDKRSQKWACPQCSEENPATFDLCWKCQASRPGFVAETTDDPEETTAPVNVDPLLGNSSVVVHEEKKTS